jgi:hypothetical protein
MMRLGRRRSVTDMKQLAEALEDRRSFFYAVHCWRTVHRLAPFNGRVLEGRLSCALRAGNVREVRRIFRDVWRKGGMPVSRVVWLAGKLACMDKSGDAAWVLRELVAHAGTAGDIVAQSPSIVFPRVRRDIGALALEVERLDSRSARSAETNADLARLCFTFGNVGVAAKLYRKAAATSALPWLDQVALLYGEARSEQKQTRPIPSEEALDGLLGVAMANSNALFMLAYVAMAAGYDKLAMATVRRAVTAKHGATAAVERVAEDCGAIFSVLGSLKDRKLDFPQGTLEPIELNGPTLPKVFVCGFGWSGSSAVYDDVRGSAGFCEFEGAGEDAILNEDAESEVTFIQSSAGLGLLWQALKANGALSWPVLWDAFALHVAGLAPIGYSQYKSCAATANHVQRYGARYTAAFRHFFEQLASVIDEPAEGAAYKLFAETTEALCRMVAEQTGGKILLFNNAVSGRNIGMLEIFRAHRALAVYRDPLDVLADRKKQDKNHWRTPEQLMAFYGKGLERYAGYKAKAASESASALREVSFERFVRDDAFRRRIREWITEGMGDRESVSHFDPAVSIRNIGIHEGALDKTDRAQLSAAVTAFDEMERLASRSWS